MNQNELTSRIQQLQPLPPNNGILLHLEDFRKLVLEMANSGKFEAKRHLIPNGRPKKLYFKIGRDMIQVKPVLTGLPLGTIALQIQ